MYAFLLLVPKCVTSYSSSSALFSARIMILSGLLIYTIFMEYWSNSPLYPSLHSCGMDISFVPNLGTYRQSFNSTLVAENIAVSRPLMIRVPPSTVILRFLDSFGLGSLMKSFNWLVTCLVAPVSASHFLCFVRARKALGKERYSVGISVLIFRMPNLVSILIDNLAFILVDKVSSILEFFSFVNMVFGIKSTALESQVCRELLPGCNTRPILRLVQSIFSITVIGNGVLSYGDRVLLYGDNVNIHYGCSVLM